MQSVWPNCANDVWDARLDYGQGSRLCNVVANINRSLEILRQMATEYNQLLRKTQSLGQQVNTAAQYGDTERVQELSQQLVAAQQELARCQQGMNQTAVLQTVLQNVNMNMDRLQTIVKPTAVQLPDKFTI